MQLMKKTRGQSTFTGPIGIKLSECETAPAVEFEVIPSDDIDVEIESLGKDQKYLLKIYRSVTRGVCPRDLSHQQPGKIHHAWWLTLASILRFYVSKEYPSQDLVQIVH